MKRETVKALLENGILQAYAEGKEIQYGGVLLEFCKFDGNPDEYSIKSTPPFKIGDLVRDNGYSTGIITALTTSHEAYVELSGKNGLKHLYPLRELTPVREVRTPLTFEQAVKLVAEHGVKLLNSRTIASIESDKIRFEDSFSLPYTEACHYDWRFEDGAKFYNVTYEDVT